MNIKQYLDIVDRLPQMPHISEIVEYAYMKEYDDNDNKTTTSYGRATFVQKQYVDRGKVKYRWEILGDIKIDYSVDSIYIMTSNGLVFATLNDLIYKYNFGNWSPHYSNMNLYYIDFKRKMWSMCDSKTEKVYYIDDDKIIDKIFFESIKEYPNGVPIIWEDI